MFLLHNLYDVVVIVVYLLAEKPCAVKGDVAADEAFEAILGFGVVA